MLRRLFAKAILAALSALILFPAAAQSAITGLVKDSSGGVLPGVSVEASGPALIEKVRTVVTDTRGRYAIVDLRPAPIGGSAGAGAGIGALTGGKKGAGIGAAAGGVGGRIYDLATRKK